MFQINGGQLLSRIQEHHYFSEPQAAEIVRELANALHFLHGKGVAHRDLKPENILCVHRDRLCPVKICDFDLGSGISFTSSLASPLATPQLMTPVSIYYLFTGLDNRLLIYPQFDSSLTWNASLYRKKPPKPGMTKLSSAKLK